MIELSRRRVRAHMLILVFVVSALWGLHHALTWQHGGIEILLTLLSASIITHCCIADSKVVGKPILLSFQWIMCLSWVVSAPAYLVWTRRLRGFGLAIGCVVLFQVIRYLTFFATCYAADGPAFFKQIGR
jgi:hypothetical protein